MDIGGDCHQFACQQNSCVDDDDDEDNDHEKVDDDDDNVCMKFKFS